MALFDAEDKARRTLAQIIGGFVILFGAYLTFRRVPATERRAEAAQKTVEVAERGQITERFTRAIDQLGSGTLEVRLGGIYALERIARDSRDDHWTIMEVLTAFVREKARAPREQEEEPREAERAVNEEEKPPQGDDAEEGLRPRTDIQAILTVIGRRKLEHEEGEKDYTLDSRGTDLRRADLRGARLKGTHLAGARLEGASLTWAHLERVNLVAARLKGAHLLGARLEGADLEGARLEGANLGYVRLEEADLQDARLEGAFLVGAHLEGAILRDARLEGADLGGARLEGAHLDGADLRSAIDLTREQVESAHCYTKERLPEELRNLADLEDRPHYVDEPQQTEAEA